MRQTPEWQREYFGRHVQLVPAENARGYRYMPPAEIPMQTYAPYQPFGNPEQIIRAIPAEGRVQEPEMKWARGPQAAYWLGEGKRKWKPRTGKWNRFRRALKIARSGFGRRGSLE